MYQLEHDFQKIFRVLRDDADAEVLRVVAEGFDEADARAFGEIVFDHNLSRFFEALGKLGVRVTTPDADPIN